jgi:hypothetical protein
VKKFVLLLCSLLVFAATAQAAPTLKSKNPMNSAVELGGDYATSPVANPDADGSVSIVQTRDKKVDRNSLDINGENLVDGATYCVWTESGGSFTLTDWTGVASVDDPATLDVDEGGFLTITDKLTDAEFGALVGKRIYVNQCNDGGNQGTVLYTPAPIAPVS